MKKNLLLSFTIIACLLIAGCNKDKDADAQPSLVGTWKGQASGNDFAVVIAGNNRATVYQGDVGSSTNAEGTYTFDATNFGLTWSYDGNLIINATGNLTDDARRIDGSFIYSLQQNPVGSGSFFLVKQ